MISAFVFDIQVAYADMQLLKHVIYKIDTFAAYYMYYLFPVRYTPSWRFCAVINTIPVVEYHIVQNFAVENFCRFIGNCKTFSVT